MPRLPVPGSDDNQWGDILNEYLSQAHKTDGTLKSNAVSADSIADDAVGLDQLDTSSSPTNGQVLSYNGSGLAWSTVSGAGSVPDADASTKGLIQLTGHLGGTAASPTVPGLATKENAITAGTTSQYFRGDKSWQTLDKSAVGLTNVDNTSDANKPVSSAAQTALNAKANTSDVVALTGSQTITGAKNFTGGLQTGGQAVVATNDSRLSDQRVPTDGSVSAVKLAADSVNEPKLDAANTPTNGQLLSYNGSNFTWVNAPAGGSDPVMGGDLSGNASTAQIVAGAVGNTELASSAVTDVKVSASAAIAQSKIANLTTDLAAKANASSTVNLTGDQSVAGIKTFSSSPIVPTPTTNTQAANKSYVDGAVAGSGALPAGGTAGQVLAKASGTDYDTEWTTAATGSSAPGVVFFDDFAGANDDAKFTAALTYAAAQTRIPYIMFPARTVNLNQGGRAPFTGMKLLGPHSSGPKNLEIGVSGQNTNHRVVLGAGITTGSNSLFHSTGELYSIYVGGLAFQSNRDSQFWSQPSGTLYSCEFHSLTFYGMKHVFGNTTTPCLITGVAFSGYWLCNAYNGGDTQFHLGGSDSELWNGGILNIEGASGTGAWAVILNNLSKSNVGKIYSTSWQGWRGIRIAGTSGRGLTLHGTVAEGRNAANPCHGSTIRIEGGLVTIRDSWISYGMGDPTAFGGGNNGVIEITGGNVLIDRPYYERATAVAESVPFIYISGGKLEARSAGTYGTWVGKPVITNAGGTVVADSTFTVN